MSSLGHPFRDRSDARNLLPTSYEIRRPAFHDHKGREKGKQVAQAMSKGRKRCPRRNSLSASRETHVTTSRRMKWRDFRFQFFDRNPQLFNAFEGSLDELQTMVFDFSERKKYDLTRSEEHTSELQSLR